MPCNSRPIPHQLEREHRQSKDGRQDKIDGSGIATERGKSYNLTVSAAVPQTLERQCSERKSQRYAKVGGPEGVMCYCQTYKKKRNEQREQEGHTCALEGFFVPFSAGIMFAGDHVMKERGNHQAQREQAQNKKRQKVK